jgi:hypothetical protein
MCSNIIWERRESSARHNDLIKAAKSYYNNNACERKRGSWIYYKRTSA